MNVALWLAVLAGAQVVAGSAAVPGLLPPAVAQWVQIAVGALGVGTAAYLRATPRYAAVAERSDEVKEAPAQERRRCDEGQDYDRASVPVRALTGRRHKHPVGE